MGTAGIDYQTAYLQTILNEAGVPPDSVTERNVGFGLTPALLTGKVDATLGAFWNYEGTELRLAGKRPQIIRIEDAGVPSYNELVLVANEDALERDGSKLRAFIGALSRGTRDLRNDPNQAIEGLLEANPDLDPGAPAGGGQGHPAAVLPARRQAVRLAGPGRSGTPSPPGWPTTACSSSRPIRRPPTTTSCCRAPGCSEGRARSCSGAPNARAPCRAERGALPGDEFAVQTPVLEVGRAPSTDPPLTRVQECYRSIN